MRSRRYKSELALWRFATAAGFAGVTAAGVKLYLVTGAPWWGVAGLALWALIARGERVQLAERRATR